MNDPNDGDVLATDPRGHETLATDLAGMARELLSKQSVQETLDSIVAHAVDLVEGCDAAGILMVRRGRARTIAASHDVARRSDEAQGRLGEGPCFDAATGGDPMYRIEDLRVDSATSRWPRYVEQARGLGIGSILGVLLYTDDHNNLGALNMYSSRPGAFSPRTGHTGWVLASHASVALWSARHAENLEQALVSSRQIGEAIGVVMARYRLTEAAAFDRIRHVSQARNVKMRALAEMITAIGELPDSL